MGIFNAWFGKSREAADRQGARKPHDTSTKSTVRSDAQLSELQNVAKDSGEVAQGLATSSGSGASGGEGAFLPFGQPVDCLKDRSQEAG